MAEEQKFGALSLRFLDNRRICKLSDRQFRILILSIFGSQAANSKRTGIFHLSTTAFQTHILLELVMQELGSDKEKLSISLKKPILELTKEDYQGGFGQFCQEFPDLIEYDPEHDMIYIKMMFEHSGSLYLTTPKSVCEGIQKDYKSSFRRVPERWWGEFVARNHHRVHEAWKKYKIHLDSKKKKEGEFNIEIKPIEEIFKTLFELEEKYSPTIFPSEPLVFKKMQSL